MDKLTPEARLGMKMVKGRMTKPEAMQYAKKLASESDLSSWTVHLDRYDVAANPFEPVWGVFV